MNSPRLPPRLSDSAKDPNNRPQPRDRLIFILRLFLPGVIFIAGILIITTKELRVDIPSWQKMIVGGLFIVYASFRLYLAVTRYFQNNGE